MKEAHPHQLTPEECAADPTRAQLNAAKQAAHEAYLATKRALELLDDLIIGKGYPCAEMPDPILIALARDTKDHAMRLHEALVRETKW
jgi:hypothetical protein